MASVRVASVADAEAVAAIYAPYVLETAISFEEEPPSVGEVANRIAATLPTYPYLVYEEAGTVIGYAYAGPHAQRRAYRWSCNVTVYTGLQAQRRGVGRALYLELLVLLGRQRLHSAFAGIALPNDPSVGLHRSDGLCAYRNLSRGGVQTSRVA